MNALARSVMVAGCALSAMCARADSLKLGYSGDAIGIQEAARIGYSGADGLSGGQLRLGLRYTGTPVQPLPDMQVEPMFALTVADERAAKLDRKDVQAGARFIFGTFAYADAALAAGVDRRTDASYDGAKVTAYLVPEALSPALRALSDRGWALRPKGGVYVERMRHSADSESEPNGRASGAWLGVGVTWLPPALPRHEAAYRNRFTRDFSASGERTRGTYRFHAVSYTYKFYDPNAKDGRKPRVSLTIERAVGADPVEGTRVRHATSAVFLGFQL